MLGTYAVTADPFSTCGPHAKNDDGGVPFEYIKASPEHKKALADIIRHRAVEVPADAMPSDLQSFIANLPQ